MSVQTPTSPKVPNRKYPISRYLLRLPVQRERNLGHQCQVFVCSTASPVMEFTALAVLHSDVLRMKARSPGFLLSNFVYKFVAARENFCKYLAAHGFPTTDFCEELCHITMHALHKMVFLLQSLHKRVCN